MTKRMWWKLGGELELGDDHPALAIFDVYIVFRDPAM